MDAIGTAVGRTQNDLFGLPRRPAELLSRLTYTNLQAHSGEALVGWNTCLASSSRDLPGGGAITGGESAGRGFCRPSFPLYSSTNSDQRDGRLAYATVDLGWTWRSEGIKLGFFAGYFYNFERVNAFGCTQTAANPFICVPPISSSVLGITQDTSWNAVRIGFNGEWRLVAAGARAWTWHGFPGLGSVRTTRIGCARSTPREEGTSFSNVQIEALLGYQFTNGISVASAADIGESTVRLRRQLKTGIRSAADDLIE